MDVQKGAVLRESTLFQHRFIHGYMQRRRDEKVSRRVFDYIAVDV